MISCSEFRATFTPATEAPALLDHVRACDACLDLAAHVDPEIIFRAIGGVEMDPPGGVDAFVADVMHAVELRSKEAAFTAPRGNGWIRRLAAAAVVAAGMTGATFFYLAQRAPAPVMAVAGIQRAHLRPAAVATKPVVETYSSSAATIMEVPGAAGDTKIVMVVDDQLPADL